MLHKITPLILTYNEAPNIGRTLEQLRWAGDIVIVDSYSDDETIDIAATFSNVRVFQRRFDSHCAQWNFGLKKTDIKTDWVLAMDADYLLTPAGVNEYRNLTPGEDTCGYRTRFVYCVNGKPLRSGIYPPATILFRPNYGRYQQDGHTQKLVVEGRIETLTSAILHDDRKSLRRWFQSQTHYSMLEAEKLLERDPAELSLADRIRRWRIVAPAAICFYCLVVRGGLFDGLSGLYYAFQRTLAELMLALYLVDHDIRAATSIVRRKRQVDRGLEATEPIDGDHGRSVFSDNSITEVAAMPPDVRRGSAPPEVTAP